MKLKYLIPLAVLYGCALQGANAQSLDNVFHAFSKCDAGFFKALKDEAQAIQTLAPTESKGDAMWIKVLNRKDEKTGAVQLTGKPTFANLPVLSYVDESSELESLGRFYYWGFKVQGNQASVIEKLRPFVSDSGRLRKDSAVYVRTELNTANSSSWQPVKTSSGVPKKGTVERAFLFEEDDKDKNVTKVFCSLQGSVEAEHLKALRPDIDPKDYPAITQDMTFENVNVAPELVAKLQESLKVQPLFIPKFKRAVIKYKLENSNEEHESLLDAAGGFTNSMTPSKFFASKNQYFASLLNTKFALVGTDEKFYARFPQLKPKGVLVLKGADIRFSNNLSKSTEIFIANYVTTKMPFEISYKETITHQVCTAGDTVPANTVFHSLSGRAVLFRCVNEQQGGEKIEHEQALIEDYGLVLRYESVTSKSSFKPVYTSITIER